MTFQVDWALVIIQLVINEPASSLQQEVPISELILKLGEQIQFFPWHTLKTNLLAFIVNMCTQMPALQGYNGIEFLTKKIFSLIYVLLIKL